MLDSFGTSLELCRWSFKLHDIMTRNIDRAVLRVAHSALRRMNENISSTRRVAAPQLDT
jgi:hypothetical protein